MPTIRHQNRVAVLNILLRYGPLSRREICKITRLTPASITNIVGELLDTGLALEMGSRHDPNGRRLGRPQVIVDLNPGGAFAVGVHLGVRTARVGLGDLKGNILKQIGFSLHLGDDSQVVLQSVAGAVSTVIQEGGIDPRRLLGVGVGCAGLVDPKAGVLRKMYHHGWQDVAVADRLGSALQLPVAVENNRNAMAMAESTFGQAQKVEEFIVVHVGTTVGSGIVIDHRVHHGRNDAAGQIGHLVLEPGGPLCTCGQRGCLDTLASEAAILHRSLQLAEGKPSSSLARLLRQAGDSPGVGLVFDAARQGDRDARAVIAEAAQYLGSAIGHLVRIFSPEMVILEGPIFDLGDLVIEPIEQSALSQAAQSLGVSTRLVRTCFGSDLMVVGGVSLALLRFLYAAEPGDWSHEIRGLTASGLSARLR